MPGITGSVMQGLGGVVSDVPKGVGEVSKKTVEQVLQTGVRELTGGMVEGEGREGIEAEMDPEEVRIQEMKMKDEEYAKQRIAQLQALNTRILEVARRQREEQVQIKETEGIQKQQIDEVKESKRKSLLARLMGSKMRGTGENRGAKQLG